MSYNNEKAPSQGSLIVGTGGAISFSGNSTGDKNKVVTWSEEDSQIDSVDFKDLLDLYDVDPPSIVSPTPPKTRVNGKPLEYGDLWFDSADLRQYTWYYGDVWVASGR